MRDFAWIPVIATLVGGGAAGAILTMLVTAYRNRRQPVGYRIDILPVFRQTVSDSRFSATVRVADGDQTLEFDNLYVASIELVNRGNRDMSTFPVGFTLAPNDAALFAESITADRHHVSTVVVPPTPLTPRRDVDYTLTPFNRRDAYRFKLFIYTAGGDPGQIEIGSPEPVAFRPMPTLVELAAAAARGTSLELGMFRITLSKD